MRVCWRVHVCWELVNLQHVFCNLTLIFFCILKVSEGSEVIFQPGNFSLACQIQNENLPHGNEHLLNWAQKKYSAVTSFTELKTTQDIYIKVGEGVYNILKILNQAWYSRPVLLVPYKFP